MYEPLESSEKFRRRKICQSWCFYSEKANFKIKKNNTKSNRNVLLKLRNLETNNLYTAKNKKEEDFKLSFRKNIANTYRVYWADKRVA